jgi:hypothetical protein
MSFAMLLEDFNKDSSKRFAKANKFLKESYGVSISKDTPYHKLEAVRESLTDSVEQMKINGKVSHSCPELSKTLLVLEAVDSLMETARIDELRSDFSTSGPYLRVINSLATQVADAVEVGDDFEDAMNQAMKVYRSSKWRFHDDAVRFDASNKAKDLLSVKEGDYVDECGMGDRLANIMSPEEIENVQAFIIVPGAKLNPEVRGKLHDYYVGRGHTPGKDNDLTDWYYERLMSDFPRDLDEDKAKFKTDDKGRETFRGKDVKSTPQAKYRGKADFTYQEPGVDTTSDHAASLRKRMRARKAKEGIGENFVKQLRALLESEVDEAEIIIAVKGIGKTVQEMIEKIGRLQNEDLPPLSDQVRETYGPNIASNFQSASSNSLQGVMDSLYAAKDEIDDMVMKMASNVADIAADTDMDMDLDGAEIDISKDIEKDISLEPAGDDLDDFGGDDAASGPEDEPLGRTKKESVEAMKKKIDEMKVMLARAKQAKK